MAKRSQLNQEKIDAILDLLEAADVLEPSHVRDIRESRGLGEARSRARDNAPDYAVERRQK